MTTPCPIDSHATDTYCDRCRAAGLEAGLAARASVASHCHPHDILTDDDFIEAAMGATVDPAPWSESWVEAWDAAVLGR